METNISGIVSGIYKLENELGDVYVGSANSKNGIAKRWSNHLSRLRKNNHLYSELQESWNRDVNNIKFEILEECNDEMLEEREDWWFKHVQRIDGWKLINKQKKPARRSPVKDKEKMVKAQTGESNGNCKYSAELIRDVKIKMAKGVSLEDLHKETGIGVNYLYLIREGYKWASVTID